MAEGYCENASGNIKLAMEGRLVLEVFYKNGMRLVDPLYTYVDKEGGELLLLWQVEGHSESGVIPGYRQFHMLEIADVKVLRTTFKPPADHKEKLEALKPVKVIASVAI